MICEFSKTYDYNSEYLHKVFSDWSVSLKELNILIGR